MKKLLIIAAVLLLTFSSLAISKGTTVAGKVMAVNGDVVTIEVEAGKGAGVAVGAAVEVEIQEQKAAPKKGSDMLQGC